MSVVKRKWEQHRLMHGNSKSKSRSRSGVYPQTAYSLADHATNHCDVTDNIDLNSNGNTYLNDENCWVTSQNPSLVWPKSLYRHQLGRLTNNFIIVVPKKNCMGMTVCSLKTCPWHFSQIHLSTDLHTFNFNGDRKLCYVSTQHGTLCVIFVWNGIRSVQVYDYHTGMRLLYRYTIIIQTYDYYTGIRLVYMYTIIIQTYDYYTGIRTAQAYDYYTGIRLLYRHTIIIQTYDYYTGIRLLYRYTIIIQVYDYYTGIRLLYRHTITIQAYDYYTGIRLLYRYTIIIQTYDYYTGMRTVQAYDYYTGIRLLYRHTITIQVYDYYTGIRTAQVYDYYTGIRTAQAYD